MDLKNKRITIGELLQNKQAKAVLNREFPGILNGPFAGLVRGFSIEHLLSYNHKGYVPQAKIDKILKELEKI